MPKAGPSRQLPNNRRYCWYSEGLDTAQNGSSGELMLRISLILNCELGCRREGLCLVGGYCPAGRPSLAGRRSADANIGGVAGLQFKRRIGQSAVVAIGDANMRQSAANRQYALNASLHDAVAVYIFKHRYSGQLAPRGGKLAGSFTAARARSAGDVERETSFSANAYKRQSIIHRDNKRQTGESRRQAR